MATMATPVTMAPVVSVTFLLMSGWRHPPAVRARCSRPAAGAGSLVRHRQRMKMNPPAGDSE